MKLDVKNNVTLAFVKDSPAIMYKGPAIVGNFKVKDIIATTNLTEEASKFIFYMDFERIYFDLPQKLHKYALANINSHLLKLKGENKL